MQLCICCSSAVAEGVFSLAEVDHPLWCDGVAMHTSALISGVCAAVLGVLKMFLSLDRCLLLGFGWLCLLCGLCDAVVSG
ncbi:hypothetical protein U1Q18_007401 [Sarracenia purpurea var. burkii]